MSKIDHLLENGAEQINCLPGLPGETSYVLLYFLSFFLQSPITEFSKNASNVEGIYHFCPVRFTENNQSLFLSFANSINFIKDETKYEFEKSDEPVIKIIEGLELYVEPAGNQYIVKQIILPFDIHNPKEISEYILNRLKDENETINTRIYTGEIKYI